MSCLAAVASPGSSTITWWREDLDGRVSQVTSMGDTNINTMSDQLMSNLTIETVDVSHTGTYTCNLTTNIGSFNASVQMQLTGQSNY